MSPRRAVPAIDLQRFGALIVLILVTASPVGAMAQQASPALSPPPWTNLQERLEASGIAVTVQNTDDVLGNPTGGRKQGATVEGQVALTMKADLDKAIGLAGASVVADGYGVYGRGLSARNIDNINLVSSIEALRSVWLYELWFQQATPDGRADLRVGQLGADAEFLVTRYGSWFVNTAFGWPSLPSVDLPAGGPAYPLATPGLRLRIRPTKALTLLAAVFNGDPAGPGLNNPQRRDSNGTLFRTDDGVYAIGEAQYAVNAGTMVKAGAWYHSKASPNAFYANDGLTSVSTAESSGIPRQDASLYGVADALLLPGSDGQGGLAAFLRFSVAPPDRSKVSAEAATGLVYEDPFGRAGDKVGLAVTSIRIGQALGIGAAAARYAFHGYETAVEVSYEIQLAQSLSIQPDVQFIAHPGGGIADFNRPGHDIGSALILGVRAVETF